MDDADNADRIIEAQREMGLLQARSAPALRPKGRCHYCDEDIAKQFLFCDLDCAHDFEAEEEQLKRMSRA